jgi:hypothetical protein
MPSVGYLYTRMAHDVIFAHVSMLLKQFTVSEEEERGTKEVPSIGYLYTCMAHDVIFVRLRVLVYVFLHGCIHTGSTYMYACIDACMHTYGSTAYVYIHTL